MKAIMLIGIVAGSILALPVKAENEYAAQMISAFDTVVRPWLSDPVVVDAIKAQNNKHANLTADDINKLDKQWRAEAKQGAGELIDSVLKNALSTYLRNKSAAANGLLTEVFMMDNKGLNVGQASITSDYMQGDEAKWQKSFAAGSTGIFVDEVDYDESSKLYQAQISVTIVDPASGQPIGAVTVGMNVETLQ